MYNFAKLLTEEPEKLERLFLLFVKVIVTLYVGDMIFSYGFSIPNLLDTMSIKSFALGQFVYFMVVAAATWFILWELIADIVLGQFFIWLLSRIGNRKKRFYSVLEFFNVATLDGDKMVPEKNIVNFADMINSYDEEAHKSINTTRSRVRQYFITTATIYILFLVSKDIHLSCGEKWVGGLIVANFLLGCILFRQLHEYLVENLDSMKKEFNTLSFIRRVFNIVNENEFVKAHYNVNLGRGRVTLTLKKENGRLPKKIKIFPIFFSNELLGQRVVSWGMKKNLSKAPVVTENIQGYEILISNVEPSEAVKAEIRKRPSTAFLHCTTEVHIQEYFEILLFEITDGYFKIP
jgi:hypothetical protein